MSARYEQTTLAPPGAFVVLAFNLFSAICKLSLDHSFGVSYN